MGKPQNTRTYKKQLDASRTSMDPNTIRQMKCARRAAQHARTKQYNIETTENREKILPEEQIERLDFRLGYNAGAVKERKKLLERIYKGLD